MLLGRGAGIDHDASRRAGLSAVDAPGGGLHPVNADPQHGGIGEDLVFAQDPGPAAELSRPATVAHHAVGAEGNGIAEFRELDRIILLRHEVDGVYAVGKAARRTHADAVGPGGTASGCHPRPCSCPG